MTFMCIVLSLCSPCRLGGRDPVLAVPSVITVYSAIEVLLQKTLRQLKQSQFVCGPQFEF